MLPDTTTLGAAFMLGLTGGLGCGFLFAWAAFKEWPVATNSKRVNRHWTYEQVPGGTYAQGHGGLPSGLRAPGCTHAGPCPDWPHPGGGISQQHSD